MHDLWALWSSRFPWPLGHLKAFLYFCLLDTPGLLRSQAGSSDSFQPFLSKVALSFQTIRRRAALCLIMVAVHVRLVSENCAQSECPYLREVLRLSRFQRLHRSTFGAAGLLATNDECFALKLGRLKDCLSHWQSIDHRWTSSRTSHSFVTTLEWRPQLAHHNYFSHLAHHWLDPSILW